MLVLVWANGIDDLRNYGKSSSPQQIAPHHFKTYSKKVDNTSPLTLGQACNFVIRGLLW